MVTIPPRLSILAQSTWSRDIHGVPTIGDIAHLRIDGRLCYIRCDVDGDGRQMIDLAAIGNWHHFKQIIQDIDPQHRPVRRNPEWTVAAAREHFAGQKVGAA